MKNKTTFTINHQNKWTAYVGQSILGKISNLIDLSTYSRIGFIFDTSTQKLFDRKIVHPVKKVNSDVIVFTMPNAEKSKSLDQAKRIYTQMIKKKFDRKSLLISVGGGIVGDLTCFVAGTYMRGINFVQVPTTLLAQVDAAIGGKGAVNFEELKNMIGIFHQPIAVVVDTTTLKTLPKRQFVSGLAEIVKYGLIADVSIIEQLEKGGANLSDSQLADIIFKCISIKGAVVAKDALEKTGDRAKLNFGHTLGHAIEASSLGKLTHGEAISIGMMFASKLSHRIGLISQEDCDRIGSLLQKLGLPVSCDNPESVLFEKIVHDKKTVEGKTQWVLLKKIGEALSNQSVSSEQLSKALKGVLV